MAACVNPIPREWGPNETLNPREAKNHWWPCWILAIKNRLIDGTWKTNLLYVEEKKKTKKELKSRAVVAHTFVHSFMYYGIHTPLEKMIF